MRRYREWVNCQFGEILYLKNGYAFHSKEYINNGIPIIRISDINEGIVTTCNSKCINELPDYDNFRILKGDILIAMSGATTGKFGVFKEDCKAYQNQRVGNFKLIADELIHKSYIYFLLYALRKKIEEDSYGGAQPNISSKKIESLKIPLPPLPEQRAIVAKIEELFSELDNGITNLKSAKEKLEIYRQAVLKKAFEGELTKEWREKQENLPTAEELLEQIKLEREAFNNKQLEEWIIKVKEWEKNGKQGKKPTKPIDVQNISSASIKDTLPSLPEIWRWTNLSALGYWSGGGTPSKSKPEYWSNGDILWISPKDMKFKLISDTLNKITLLATQETNVKPINKDSILFVVRSGILRRTLPVSITSTSATINQDLKALSLFLVNPDFVYWYCILKEYDIRHSCAKDGTTVESIETTRLKNYPFPLSSVEEQLQIVKEIESRLSVCDHLAATIEENLEKAEALRQSILKKAFEGTLLSDEELEKCRREPDWEPAEVLLKRIKNEKQNNKKIKK